MQIVEFDVQDLLVQGGLKPIQQVENRIILPLIQQRIGLRKQQLVFLIYMVA